MPDTVFLVLLGAVLAVAAIAPAVVRRRRTERRARATAARAEAYGLHEPVSLHPVVDPAVCLGCGACTRACPEGDVLALVGGHAEAVAPARCVGHGMCERACPVGAITLVFGTARRGVELPRVQGDYQTNVPGLYIVGELGGMGLVRNAFEQGRQAVAGIAKAVAKEGRATEGVFDVLVVGGGPAGLATAIALSRAGLTYRVVEKEDSLGGAVRHYPRRKLFLTRPFTVPGWGKLGAATVLKEDLMALFERMARETAVAAHVEPGHTVTSVAPEPGGGFTIASREGGRWRARRVVLAIGRRGVPRKLGVPGEASSHVAYGLAEPEAYAGRRVLVVGGGDSAVEAALMLGDQPGTDVHLSYRGERLTRVKAANADRFAQAAAAGRVHPLWNTTVAAIEPARARLDSPEGSAEVPADDVFVFAGGELPTPFLQACGIEIDVMFGTPR